MKLSTDYTDLTVFLHRGVCLTQKEQNTQIWQVALLLLSASPPTRDERRLTLAPTGVELRLRRLPVYRHQGVLLAATSIPEA